MNSRRLIDRTSAGIRSLSRSEMLENWITKVIVSLGARWPVMALSVREQLRQVRPLSNRFRTLGAAWYRLQAHGLEWVLGV